MQAKKVYNSPENQVLRSPKDVPTDGKTPLTVTFFNELHRGRFSKVKELIECGVDVNQRDPLNLWSAIHHLAFVGNTKGILFLHSLGADIDTQDGSGITPLHLAAANGKTKTVQTLIALGGRVDRMDDEGRLPYDVAANDRIRAICELKSDVKIPSRPTSQLNTPNGTPVKRKLRNDFDDEEKPEIVKEESGFSKVYANAKRIAKWQIMSILARILLCYLLELFMDQLKRILQLVFITYSPLDVIQIVIIEPLKLFLQPLYPFFEPLFTYLSDKMNQLMLPFYNLASYILSIFYPLLSKLYWIFYPFQKIILEPLFNIFWGLGSGIYTLLYPIFSLVWSIFDSIFRLIAAPLMYLAQYVPLIMKQIFLFFKNVFSVHFAKIDPHLDKLREKAIQSVQPFLNIQGFFSRVFGPFISGLKAILHWFLPLSLLNPIQKLSWAIFGESKLGNQVNTEETALMVIFVFLVTSYGSILAGGYAYKILYKTMGLVENPVFGKLDDLTKWVNHGDTQNDYSLYMPDVFHHKMGALVTLVLAICIIIYNLIRLVVLKLKSKRKVD